MIPSGKGEVVPGTWWGGVTKENDHFQFCTFQINWRSLLGSQKLFCVCTVYNDEKGTFAMVVSIASVVAKTISLTGPGYILPNYLLITSDLSVSSLLSGLHLTWCNFPFCFYSLLWCSCQIIVFLQYLSPLPTRCICTKPVLVVFCWRETFNKTALLSSFKSLFQIYIVF